MTNEAFTSTNRNNLDSPAYYRNPITLITAIVCPACGSLAHLKLDHMERRYECTETDCQHAVMASLIENGGDK